MSNAESHLVAAGTRVAEALPLVDALLAQSDPRHEPLMEVAVECGSRAVPTYRARTPPDACVHYQLCVPAEHATEYVAVLDPLIINSEAQHRDWPWHREPDGSCWIWVPHNQSAALDALPGLPEVPVEISSTDIPRAILNHGLIPTETDPMRAGVVWSAWWPPVPELALPPHLKHAAVQLFVNSSGLWDLKPDEPGYRVYVVGAYNGRARAAHIAAAAGLAVIGEPESY